MLFKFTCHNSTVFNHPFAPTRCRVECFLNVVKMFSHKYSLIAQRKEDTSKRFAGDEGNVYEQCKFD